MKTILEVVSVTERTEETNAQFNRDLKDYLFDHTRSLIDNLITDELLNDLENETTDSPEFNSYIEPVSLLHSLFNESDDLYKFLAGTNERTGYLPGFTKEMVKIIDMDIDYLRNCTFCEPESKGVGDLIIYNFIDRCCKFFYNEYGVNTITTAAMVIKNLMDSGFTGLDNFLEYYIESLANPKWRIDNLRFYSEWERHGYIDDDLLQ